MASIESRVACVAACKIIVLGPRGGGGGVTEGDGE